MQNALITGSDGFIGSHLTELLLSHEYKVRALAHYNSFNFWGWLEDIPSHPNLEVVTGDVRNPHFIKQIVEGMDVIFHLAALIAIPYSYIAPDCYVDTNIIGTLNICQAAKELGGIRVINTSTSEVYGTAKYVPIDENHPRQPQSPYSASKIAADAIAMSFYHSFDLPVTTVRPFNTYGPRQSLRAIIPSIITQIAKNVSVLNLGDLTPTRDFNYVKDTVSGFLAIAECDSSIGMEVNIASNYEISMAEILDMIKQIMNSDAQVAKDDKRIRPHSSEVYRLHGNNKLITSLTDWRPQYSLEQGLKETCRWFTRSENLKKFKTDIYNY